MNQSSEQSDERAVLDSVTSPNSGAVSEAIEAYKLVYLDYQATTPVDPTVLDAMMPYFCDLFGNPHSVEHRFGWQAASAIARAQERIAHSLDVEPEDIVFVSGATEANNLAIRGIAASRPAKQNHLISSPTEHKCVLNILKKLEQQGSRVTLIPVGSDGLVDPDDVRRSIRANTTLVSIMTVNNETGVVQPIEEIARICAEAGVPFHTDAAQAVGKLPLSLSECEVGLASVSAHKLYGPQGIGALIAHRELREQIHPLMYGGDQQSGLRSGTVPTALVVGFAEAVELSIATLEREMDHLSVLRNAFLEELSNYAGHFHIHGSMTDRIPGNVSIGFDGIDTESLLPLIPNIAVSSGAACSSDTPEPSHVLMAMGIDYDAIAGSIRVGFGRPTTLEEVRHAAKRIGEGVTLLRK